MRTFCLTSTTFNGEVVFEFNEAGLLVNYDTRNADLSESQQLWVLRKMPRELHELQRVIQGSKAAKLTEVNRQITFALFWDRYDEKIRSSKKKALIKWNRLSKTDQAKAFYFIPKYEGSIPQGVAKKYAESYLNAELWNN